MAYQVVVKHDADSAYQSLMPLEHPTFKLTQPLAGIFDFSSFKLLSITKSNGQPLLLEDQTLYQCGGNPVPCQNYNQLRLSQAWVTEGDKASLELKFAEDLLPQENFTVKYVLLRS